MSAAIQFARVRRIIARGGKRPEPSIRHITERAESPSVPALQVSSGEGSAAPSLPQIQPGPPSPFACRLYFWRDRVRRVLRVGGSGRNVFRMLWPSTSNATSAYLLRNPDRCHLWLQARRPSSLGSTYVSRWGLEGQRCNADGSWLVHNSLATRNPRSTTRVEG